ncbi:CHC2 zinc finger domain-containing protein [Parabacteroides gordonii]|jgi:hypothetical protein|uniref:DNA primase n=1 Tax=Parabacteroides gordonii TaxID=574930 RepID=UPI0024201170|nr:CHC2 zinc finger domain-containing protein [Parabacteroides gordonii]
MTKLEIERLKSSLRIEEVIGKTVRLERKGVNYVGLCPFHDDHHPSLAVNSQKQTFHCFACGEHGDVIGFVQKTEHCSFTEAIKKLRGDNGQANVTPKRSINGCAKLQPAATGRLSAEKKLQFLSSLLPYACGNSELTPAYLDFEVGQSPVKVAREWYPMRGRIIFPIRDEAGGLIAFAGRKQAEDTSGEPKYKNTSTADGYKKSENLYALYRAREAIVREGFAFIVEGYKDAIAMHAAGFTNTVALCGTELTGNQAALLKKYTTRLYLLLDGDKPGREAARKIALSSGENRMEITTLSLPEGEDPDALFRRLGKEAFVSLIHKYQSKPHLSEELLLMACLQYSDAFYMFKGSLCLFTELLNSILRTDDLLFENKEYKLILDHLAEGHLESNLSPALKRIAGELHTEYDRIFQEEEEAFGLLYPGASNVRDIYLTRLLFLYSENRILREIQKEVTRLLKTPSGNKEKRLSHLVRIADRREQLRHVSENLDRPGAVWIE